jgi:phage gpG-like protein
MNAGTITGADAVIARLKAMPEVLRPRIRKIIEKFAIDVQASAKQKLSDDYLAVRTGRLRRSITFAVNDQGTAIMGNVGSNVDYAARQEYGFSGTESVRSFMRNQSMAFGKPITPRMVSVRAFSRHANTPAKHFLRDSLQGAKPSLYERLAAMKVTP